MGYHVDDKNHSVWYFDPSCDLTGQADLFETLTYNIAPYKGKYLVVHKSKTAIRGKTILK